MAAPTEFRRETIPGFNTLERALISLIRFGPGCFGALKWCVLMYHVERCDTWGSQKSQDAHSVGQALSGIFDRTAGEWVRGPAGVGETTYKLLTRELVEVDNILSRAYVSSRRGDADPPGIPGQLDCPAGPHRGLPARPGRFLYASLFRSHTPRGSTSGSGSGSARFRQLRQSRQPRSGSPRDPTSDRYNKRAGFTLRGPHSFRGHRRARKYRHCRDPGSDRTHAPGTSERQRPAAGTTGGDWGTLRAHHARTDCLD